MIWLFSFFIGMAQAGYLQIVGESSVRLEKNSQSLMIVGEYQLKNQGDETARNVFPEISVDNFTWKGEPVMMDAGNSYTWKISQTISDRNLILPPLGRYAMVIFHHYEDLNAYPFAIPSVRLLSLGATGTAHEPTFQMQVQPLEENLYSAQFSITNTAPSAIRFLPQYVLPREIELRSVQLPLEIPDKGELSSSFIFENKKGLIGSNYHAFLILRWIENGQRQAAVTGANFRIEKNQVSKKAWNSQQIFWAWWFWATAWGLIGMWALWIRPLRRFAKA